MIFVTITLCVVLLGWVYTDYESMDIYHKWHDYLVDETGARIAPNQLINMGKIINMTDDYVARTNAFGRLYDQVFQTNLESLPPWHHVYSDERELKMSGWPVSNQTRCGQHLDWIHERLKANKHYQLLMGKLGHELTSLMDSFGKFETGTYAGQMFWTGSYSMCQRVSLDSGRIKSRYCVAKMRPIWWPVREPVYPKSRVRIGVCLPEACDTLSFEAHKGKIEALVKFDQPEFFKANLSFEGLYCLPDERSPIRKIPLGGRILLLLAVAWLSAILVATMVQSILRRREKRMAFLSSILELKSGASDKVEPQPERLLQHATVVEAGRPGGETDGEVARAATSECLKLLELLSLQHIWRQFKSDELSEKIERELRAGREVRLDMRSMNMVKIILTICIVWGHSALIVPFLTRVISHRVELNTGPTARFFMNFSLFVDTFFMLFGLIFAHSLHKRFGPDKLTNPLVWVAINMNIIARVGPLFALIYWFVRSILPYMGAGPWWDYGTYRYSWRGICRKEPWYKSIPYLGQLDEPHAVYCNGPAWFVVSYSQLALVMPLIVYLLYKLPNATCRLLLVAFTIAMGPLQLGLKFSKQLVLGAHVDWNQYGALIATLLEKFESTGLFSAIGRVGSVSIGCYVGYLLRMYELRLIDTWPRWMVSRITLTLASLVQLFIFVLPIINYGLNKDVGQKSGPAECVAVYLCMSVVWLSLLSIQLINCFTVRNRTALVRFANRTFWHVFNKLGFCIYLVHWELMMFVSTHYEQGVSHGFHTDFWKMFACGLVYGVPISFALHLLFEAPMTQLLKWLIGPSG